MVNPCVARSGDAVVGLSNVDNPRSKCLHQARCVIGRSIVYDDNLSIGKVLIDRALYGVGDIACLVIRRYDRGDERAHAALRGPDPLVVLRHAFATVFSPCDHVHGTIIRDIAGTETGKGWLRAGRARGALAGAQKGRLAPAPDSLEACAEVRVHSVECTVAHVRGARCPPHIAVAIRIPYAGDNIVKIHPRLLAKIDKTEPAEPGQLLDHPCRMRQREAEIGIRPQILRVTKTLALIAIQEQGPAPVRTAVSPHACGGTLVGFATVRGEDEQPTWTQ